MKMKVSIQNPDIFSDIYRIQTTREVKDDFKLVLDALEYEERSGQELANQLKVSGRKMAGMCGSMDYYHLIEKTGEYEKSSPIYRITKLGKENLEVGSKEEKT